MSICNGKSPEIRDRFENLSAMNTLIKSLNDENAYFNHWVYIVPDGADEEELLCIAEDELQFANAAACFIWCMKRYTRKGLFVGGSRFGVGIV